MAKSDLVVAPAALGVYTLETFFDDDRQSDMVRQSFRMSFGGSGGFVMTIDFLRVTRLVNDEVSNKMCNAWQALVNTPVVLGYSVVDDPQILARAMLRFVASVVAETMVCDDDIFVSFEYGCGCISKSRIVRSISDWRIAGWLMDAGFMLTVKSGQSFSLPIFRSALKMITSNPVSRAEAIAWRPNFSATFKPRQD